MAAPKFGVAPPEWAKHLRPDGRRVFWRRVRRKFKKELSKGQE